MKLIKSFTKSKKFWATVSGCAVVVGKEYLNLPEEAVLQVVGMLMAYIVGQGVADIGKHSK